MAGLVFQIEKPRIRLPMTSHGINTIAAEGFEKAATVYEQARPSYPTEAINFISSLGNKPDMIVDLGAGTGKLTRLLGPIGARDVVAIEPVASMRDNLRKIPLITKIIDGSAEHIPFDDHTVDMIICGQSFHWFAHHRALKEFNRVLKRNGFLILVFNQTNDNGKAWAENITKYVDSFRPSEAPCYKIMEWKKAFDNQTLFSELRHQQFNHKERITPDLAVNRILSTSFVATWPQEQQKKLVDEVRKMLADADELRDTQEFDAHHLTHVYWCSPVQSSS